MKAYGPYIEIPLGYHSSEWRRYTLPYEDEVMRVVYSDAWWHTNCRNRRFKSKEEAMASADSLLIDEGYRLLTLEQYEKLSVLP